MYNLTLQGQGQNLTSGQLGARLLGDPGRSNYTSFDARCGDQRNDTNPTSQLHLDLKLLAKKLLVTSSDLDEEESLEGSPTKNFTWSINKYLT